MKFWVRENGSPPFHGPFTLAEVAAGLTAGKFSAGCELLLAEGQSYGALTRATGWRSWRDFQLPGIPDTGVRVVLPLTTRPGRRYPALHMLAVWYTMLAFVAGIVAAIGCIYLGIVVLNRDAASGTTMLLTFMVGGAVSVITLLAIAEGIKLAIDVAADLREIRDRLSRDDAGPGAADQRRG
jgi:hypothetical protein